MVCAVDEEVLGVPEKMQPRGKVTFWEWVPVNVGQTWQNAERRKSAGV